MERITKQMIVNGLNQDIIKPILDDGELVCEIGDGWFYFGGHEFENTDPSDIPFDVLVNEILTVLDAFHDDWQDYKDEYLYYLYYLNERTH